MANVLFLHGLDSQPGGIKPAFLQSQGHVVYNPALPREDFIASVNIAQEALAFHPVDVIVGSSRGGAVALAMETGRVPVIAIAPAWQFFTLSPVLPAVLRILHSPHDSLIPVEHSRELLALAPPDADIELMEVGLSHGMTDPDALAMLDRCVRALSTGRS